MTTPFEEIEDLFLSQIKDYKIDQLYQLSIADPNNPTTVLTDYLEGLLLSAIPDFDNCIQNLEDYDLTTPSSFNVTLTLMEKTILADLMVIRWLNKEIQDVTQMNNFLSDTDFKMYSNSQNLREKSAYRNQLREIIDLKMTKYGIKNTDWGAWSLGNYDLS